MLSPMMTVVVLAVLWLIVVVPMLFRRHDERARERSVDGFGKTMRALGRRASRTDTRAEVFVPSARASEPSVTTRRPVPAAQEALMYPAEQSEMSAAREAMMARRRRSLGTLGVGSIVFVPVALMVGGFMWILALPFALGLAGYLLFLRSQAQRDRERRYNRQQRASERRTRSSDLTAERHLVHAGAPTAAPEYAPEPMESVVRIDDDDIDLHNMDTIDLTGLYNDGLTEAATQRRAS